MWKGRKPRNFHSAFGGGKGEKYILHDRHLHRKRKLEGCLLDDMVPTDHPVFLNKQALHGGHTN